MSRGQCFYSLHIMIYALVVMVSFVFTGHVNGAILVEPAREILSLEPEERGTGVITVTNDGEGDLDLIVVLYDWTLNDQDELVIYERGTLKESLDELIRFNPRQFTLGSGESQLVRYTITYPQIEEGKEVQDGDLFERRGIIFFEHEELFEGDGVGANIKTMVGTTIYAMPAEYQMRFSLLDALVHITEDDKYIGALLIRNDSRVHGRYSIKYTVVDSRSRVIEEGTTSQNVILPDFVRGVFFPLEGNYEPGNYRLLVEFHFYWVSDVWQHTVPFEVEK